MEGVQEYGLVARNTATTSANRIHDDEEARRFGFSGGLVPGVDVYAYMTHPPAEAWGLDWLRRGSMRARFLEPVYDGDHVVVIPGEVAVTAAGRLVPLELRNAEGAVCATGEAWLPAGTETEPVAVTWPAVAPTADPPPASPDALAPGTTLALAPHGFRADRAGEYLDDVGERLTLYDRHRVAHPGWILRDANQVLSSNVVLGPWIHVESVTRHHGLVTDGDEVSARATVTREWERRGHRFVELDVGVFTGGDVLVARVTHTAIYRPRQAAGDDAAG